MELTLSIGGGITGLAKEHTIDVGSLDPSTHGALMDYINRHSHVPIQHANLTETWIVDGRQEIPILKDGMPAQLQQLYNSMRKQVRYPNP